MLGRSERKEIFYATILLIFSLLCTIPVVYMTLKMKKIDKVMGSIEEETKKVYLAGFSISRWVETNAFRRFLHWHEDDGFCYALSTLAMITFKNVKAKNIRIVRGADKADLGKPPSEKHCHSWVEIKIPLTGWVVIDLSWTDSRIISRKTYLKLFALEPEWECSYERFWSIPYSNMLRKAMECQKTSNIFLNLFAYNPKENGLYEFEYKDHEDWPDNLPFKGEVMLPFYHVNEKKLISTRVLRDFVKNPRRLQPKAHSCRTAVYVRRTILNAIKNQRNEASG